MATYRAAQYNDNGDDTDILIVANVPYLSPPKDHIVVKTVSAAINPVDGKVFRGHLKGAGWAMPLPFVPGYDFSGVVEEVGSGVVDFKKGDAVWAVQWGQGKHDQDGIPPRRAPAISSNRTICG
jgi:NADPH:quinone reductase-like Zn-dependent oxidoreductase